MTVGQRIVAMRKAIGIKQKDLAHLLSIPANSLSNYERDVSSCPPPVLKLISTLLHIPFQYLLDGTGPSWDNEWEPSGRLRTKEHSDRTENHVVEYDDNINRHRDVESLSRETLHGTCLVSEALAACEEIMRSDDEEIKTALHYNLIAFRASVRTRKKNKALERRIDALEAHLNQSDPGTKKAQET